MVTNITNSETSSTAARLSTFVRALMLFVFALSCVHPTANADEIILDESLVDMQTVGDFDVSTFVEPIDLSERALLTNGGEIDAGKLYSYFKSQGLKEVFELNLCLDVEGGHRSDHALNGIELHVLNEDQSTNQVYRLGDDNILKLPGYEASDYKPEAGITIKLGYDFMEQFDETSTQKLKLTVDGQEINSLPLRVAYLGPTNQFNFNRLIFLSCFAVFWVFVFMVLFRATLPRDRNMASPA